MLSLTAMTIQVLVCHDILGETVCCCFVDCLFLTDSAGMYPRMVPKFVRQYADIGSQMRRAFQVR
jgi:ketopantoate hydroxymethyltransferase